MGWFFMEYAVLKWYTAPQNPFDDVWVLLFQIRSTSSSLRKDLSCWRFDLDDLHKRHGPTVKILPYWGCILISKQLQSQFVLKMIFIDYRNTPCSQSSQQKNNQKFHFWIFKASTKNAAYIDWLLRKNRIVPDLTFNSRHGNDKFKSLPRIYSSKILQNLTTVSKMPKINTFPGYRL